MVDFSSSFRDGGNYKEQGEYTIHIFVKMVDFSSPLRDGGNYKENALPKREDSYGSSDC
jgi:hypothetical protein